MKTMHASHLMKQAVTIAAVGVIALGEMVPAIAAPVFSSTVGVKMAAPELVGQVRFRGRGAAIGAGVALGVIGAVAGAAAAQNSYYGPGYYGPGYAGYYNDPGYYGTGYYGSAAYGPGRTYTVARPIELQFVAYLGTPGGIVPSTAIMKMTNALKLTSMKLLRSICRNA
jgi:hypothetical protein